MLREWKWCSAQFFCLLYERWYIEIGEEYPRFAFATERKGQRLVVVVIVVVMVVVGSGGGGGSGPVLDSGWIFHGLETRRLILLLRSGPSLLLLRSCSFFLSYSLSTTDYIHAYRESPLATPDRTKYISRNEKRSWYVTQIIPTELTHLSRYGFFFFFLYCYRGRL